MLARTVWARLIIIIVQLNGICSQMIKLQTNKTQKQQTKISQQRQQQQQ